MGGVQQGSPIEGYQRGGGCATRLGGWGLRTVEGWELGGGWGGLKRHHHRGHGGTQGNSFFPAWDLSRFAELPMVRVAVLRPYAIGLSGYFFIVSCK
jgi:hypothetical protein